MEEEDSPRKSQRKRQKTAQETDEVATEDTPMEEDTSLEPEATLSAERLRQFKNGLTKYMRDNRSQTVTLEVLKEHINEGVARLEPFSDAEIDSAVTTMTRANQVMLADKMLFLI